MVEHQIARRGIRDERVLAAIRGIPREAFLPADVQSEAYDDRAVPIGLGQTVSQPYIVAYMTEALDVRPEHRVLEIGTGTGYQTAVLARLARQVYSIERLPDLHYAAASRLSSLEVGNVVLRLADGSKGWPAEAPFDRIIVTAAGPEVAPEWVEQLVEGGRLVAPVGPDAAQNLVRVDRFEGRSVETVLIPVRFVRLIGDAGFPE
jgi:protein-L-isoaspartate(D-aspartate) O-methyltransferase